MSLVGAGYTNSDHEQLSRANHVDNTIRVLEDFQHHLLLILGSRTVLGMGARMYDAVHVQVEMVELLSVRVGPSSINRYDGAIVHDDRLVLYHGRDDLGILVGKPSEGGGDTHDCGGGCSAPGKTE